MKEKKIGKKKALILLKFYSWVKECPLNMSSRKDKKNILYMVGGFVASVYYSLS